MKIDDDMLRYISDQELADALGAQCTGLGKILDEFERRGKRLEVRHELHVERLEPMRGMVTNLIVYRWIKK